MPAQCISHPVFARYYARLSSAMGKGGMATPAAASPWPDWPVI
jgi:hypothetical protein